MIEKERGKYIDAHVHVWAPDTDHYPVAAGFKKEPQLKFQNIAYRVEGV